MKKLLTLAAIVGLGISAIGCSPAAAPPATPPAGGSTPAETKKEGDAAAAPAPTDTAAPAPGDEKK